jgi:hypothetical protein
MTLQLPPGVSVEIPRLGKPTKAGMLKTAAVVVALASGVLGWWIGHSVGPSLGQREISGVDRSIDPPPRPPLPPDPFAGR